AQRRTGGSAGGTPGRRMRRHARAANRLMTSLRTLPEALAGAAQGSAGYCFVVDGVETPRSYADIYRNALGVARSLRESGLRRGDLVAIVLADAEQYLTALFGASIAGVVPASIYPPSTT